jgi:hypothetical protein
MSESCGNVSFARGFTYAAAAADAFDPDAREARADGSTGTAAHPLAGVGVDPQTPPPCGRAGHRTYSGVGPRVSHFGSEPSTSAPCSWLPPDVAIRGLNWTMAGILLAVFETTYLGRQPDGVRSHGRICSPARERFPARVVLGLYRRGFPTRIGVGSGRRRYPSIPKPRNPGASG